jgi:hypothetical protein
MKGYVINTSPRWIHAMKRTIGPGQRIDLSELYEQYGVKHDLPDSPEFVEWLKSVKLRDNKKWKFVVDEEVIAKANNEEKKEAKQSPQNITPFVTTKPSVQDVVEMSVRVARENLPRIHDLNLLKYALQEANQLAGKDSLCKIIRKRIRDLQIAR